MAPSVNDGRVKVWEVPSIADISAPTVAELNAGRSLECDLDSDGGLMGFSPTTGRIDVTPMCGTFKITAAGRVAYDEPALKFFKRTSSDPNIGVLVAGYATHIVIRRDMTASAAWAAAQNVEVYPVECNTRQEGEVAVESVHKIVYPLSITAPPDLDAVVAA